MERFFLFPPLHFELFLIPYTHTNFDFNLNPLPPHLESIHTLYSVCLLLHWILFIYSLYLSFYLTSCRSVE